MTQKEQPQWEEIRKLIFIRHQSLEQAESAYAEAKVIIPDLIKKEREESYKHGFTEAKKWDNKMVLLAREDERKKYLSEKKQLVKTINAMSVRYPEFLLKAILYDNEIMINTGKSRN